jgi:hypothetical protein
MSAAVMSKSEGIGERTICLSLSSFLFTSQDAMTSTDALQPIEDADASIRLVLLGRFQMQIRGDSTGVAFLPTIDRSTALQPSRMPALRPRRSASARRGTDALTGAGACGRRSRFRTGSFW